MATTESNATTAQKCRDILETLEQNYSGLLTQIHQRTGTPSTNQAKVTQIYTCLVNLKNAVENLPDIDQDLESQISEIGSLRERLEKKNEFIKRLQSGEFNKYEGEDM
ncbi:unnamed protein product [Bursaphelenchus okinawaensis]|uniref:Mediator of RNA polymerase II transcription subunit 9 n=1 Tax=Bursaphelenchus okinawaensis TaxID=465554 RepID=A0A811KU11_9BILA|nr:unnamed protein product [Bursaphelenchus okinawaensis]CAG9110750.1 unnamed protein product [Bursaphelenchus okinawaensis]